MKFTRKKISKLLHNTPNVTATLGELVQFFRSPQYNPEEEHDGNIIEDFLEFRGDLNHSIEEAKQYYENSINILSKNLTPSKPLPKKIVKMLEEQQKEKDKLLNEGL